MDVRTLCLGVLALGESSGYEIKKTFEQSFHHFFGASYGSIYPALAELERAGWVEVEAVEQSKRPDKKVYRMTRAGRLALEERLAAEAPRHRVRSEFLVLMYFAHLLPPNRPAAVLDAMIERMTHTLEVEFSTCDAGDAELTPGQRFALGYGRAVYTAALRYMHEQRDDFLAEVAATDAAGPGWPDGGLAVAGE
ncbi:MAG: PadR family transcriptional regulator [Geminicoccaceae bacterium]|nr:MAG: PadR family transcriptional regulator [Geminicoccaceae bacterium]